MYLSRLVKQQQLIDQMHAEKIFQARDGRPLNKLNVSELERERLRIKDQRELKELQA